MVVIFFIFIGTQKRMLLVLSLAVVLKQRFNKLINGRNQRNRDQKYDLVFLQGHDQSQKFWLILPKNR